MTTLNDLLQQPEAVPAALPSTEAQVAQKSVQDAQPKAGPVEFVKAVVDRDWVSSSLDRAGANHGFARDPAYLTPTVDTPEGKAQWAGVAPEDYNQFLDIHSQAQWDWRKAEYQKRQELEQQISTWGIPGIAARFVGGMADPVGVLAGALTGPLAVAKSATRLSNAIRAGVVVAGTNIAIDQALATGNPEHTSTDTAIAGLTGLALGLPIGALHAPREIAAMKRSVQGGINSIVAEEAAHMGGISVTEAAHKLSLTDSAGAQRASVAELHLKNEEHIQDFLDNVKPGDKVPETSFAEARLDYSSITHGSPDEYVRNTVGRLNTDPVGPKDRVTPSPTGADQLQIMRARPVSAEIHSVIDKQYEAWKKLKGIGFEAGSTYEKNHATFMEEVGRYNLGAEPNASGPAKAVGEAMKGHYAKYGDELVNAGIMQEKVKDFGMPHMWDGERVNENDLKFGTENMTSFVADNPGLRESFLGKAVLADEVNGERNLRKLARGVLQRVWNVSRGIDMEALHGVSMHDQAYIKELLQEVGMSADGVKYVEAQLEKAKAASSSSDAGKPNIAKHRLVLDMNHTAEMFSNTLGRREKLSMHELFKTNALDVFERYNRSASGRLAIQKAMGVTKDSEFTQVLNNIRSRAVGDSADARNASTTRITNAATDSYNHILGRPLENNPGGSYARTGRLMRDWAHSTSGGSFGLAQIGDLGKAVSVGSFKGLVQSIPEMRSVLRQIRTGNVTDTFLKELSDFASIGLEHQANSLHHSDYDEIFASKLGKVSYAVKWASHQVSKLSGVRQVNEWSQVMTAKEIVRRFAKTSTPYTVPRLASMGLSAEDAVAIKAALNKHGSFGGADPTHSMGLDKWEDPALVNRFTGAVRRVATRAIQENDFSSTMPWMHTTTGKLISQFRSFMAVGWAKSTLHEAYARDWETFSTMAWGMFFGGLSYMAYGAAYYSPKDYKERFSPESIAKAAFARTSWSTIMPSLVDTPRTALGYAPIFDYRSSGLASGGFKSIALVGKIDKAGQFSSAVTQSLFGDHTFSKQDLKNGQQLMPMGNLIGAAHITNAIAEGFDLPDKSH
jgi:hypothetical protein